MSFRMVSITRRLLALETKPKGFITIVKNVNVHEMIRLMHVFRLVPSSPNPEEDLPRSFS